MALQTRAVVVSRRTEYEELLERHSTRGQAEFFLSSRNRSLDEVQQVHQQIVDAQQQIIAAIPADWRLAQVERRDLDRFLFADGDVVIVVGQDGLVANVAKYLEGQPVLGVNPLPEMNPGVLVAHSVASAVELLAAGLKVGAGQWQTNQLTMVEAISDDGQTLHALNEVFVGHPSHQSARYILQCDRGSETQSSSGLIIGTGVGATGWCASISKERGGRQLPAATEQKLAWFVREAWPSQFTGTTLTEGELGEGEKLVITVQSDGLVLFGDGMEQDRITLGWGQEVRVGVSSKTLRLVI